MSNLAEVVNENVGKGSFEMICFFKDLVKSGKLKAYALDGRLTPVNDFNTYQPFVLEDSETGFMYALRISSEGGMFTNDGDSQTIYDRCVVQKLNSKDKDKISDELRLLTVPGEMVSARLNVNRDDDWDSSGESDYISASRGRLVVEGENDGLFTKICEFVRAKE